MNVYKYVSENEYSEMIECGIKLSANFDRSMIIDGRKRMFISTYILPGDAKDDKRIENISSARIEDISSARVEDIDAEQFEDMSVAQSPNMDARQPEDARLLSIEIDTDDCFIADKVLYDYSTVDEKFIEVYHMSLIPMKDYKFGMYRKPECLIGKSILPGDISIREGPLGAPLLAQSSKEVYIENKLREIEEKLGSEKEMLLYFYYEKLHEKGFVKKYYNKNSEFSIYKDVDGNLIFLKEIMDYN